MGSVYEHHEPVTCCHGVQLTPHLSYPLSTPNWEKASRSGPPRPPSLQALSPLCLIPRPSLLAADGPSDVPQSRASYRSPDWWHYYSPSSIVCRHDRPSSSRARWVSEHSPFRGKRDECQCTQGTRNHRRALQERHASCHEAMAEIRWRSVSFLPQTACRSAATFRYGTWWGNRPCFCLGASCDQPYDQNKPEDGNERKYNSLGESEVEIAKSNVEVRDLPKRNSTIVRTYGSHEAFQAMSIGYIFEDFYV